MFAQDMLSFLKKKGNFMKKDDLPAMPFYVGDWFKCPEVRALKPDYRGLWFDMLCFMWESSERGVMVQKNGKPFSNDEIFQMVGFDCDKSFKWLEVLEEKEIFSRRADGAIFSRRMVKMEEIRQIRAKSGKRGGICSSKTSSKSEAKP